MENPVLITGASSGIGRALADQFAANGHELVLVARREEKLEDAARTFADRYGTNCELVAMDLSTPESPFSLHEEVVNRDIEVEVLVNNVGIGTQGKFVDIDAEQEADQMQLNMVTPTQLAKLFGQGMVERGSGKILNVASLAAFLPGPYMAVYYASKSYMVSLTEAIAEELDSEGVTVTALCPGPVKTEFQERAEMTDTRIGSSRFQDVETVAEAGYDGVMAGETVVIPGLEYRTLIPLTRVVPDALLRKVVGWFNR